MLIVRRVALLIFFVGLLWIGWKFAHGNAERVSIDLLALRFEGVSLWLVQLLSFTLGGIVVGLIVMVEVVRSNLMTRRYRKQVSKLEAEIHQLRNLPLSGGDPALADEMADVEASPVP